MKRLKVWLTLTFGIGFTMILVFPWVLGLRPVTREDRLNFAIFLGVYVTVLFVLFALAFVLSWRLVRKQQEEFLEAKQENMKELIEGTIADHERKRS